MKFYFLDVIKIFVSLLFYVIIFKVKSIKTLKLIAVIINTCMMLEVINDLIKEEKWIKHDKKLKKDINDLNNKENIISNYYKETKKNSEELIKIKHDMKNELQIAYVIASKDKKQATKILDKACEKLENVKISTYCRNDILNAILTIKMIEAKDYGINLDIKMDSDIDLKMEEIDICNLLSNILDNSIEATKKCKNKNIKLYILKRNNYIVIKCENTYNDNLKKGNNGKLITTKTDGKKHGYGIKIITDIVDKYKGEMNIQTQDNIFRIVIIFPNKILAN